MFGYQRRAIVLLLAIGVVIAFGLFLLFNWHAGPTCLEQQESMNVLCST